VPLAVFGKQGRMALLIGLGQYSLNKAKNDLVN
jgi:hypothetical protein